MFHILLILCRFSCAKRLFIKIRGDPVEQQLNNMQIREVPPGMTCSICLCKLDNSSKVVFLNCSHFFHQACISQWFHITRSCPLCKEPFSTETTPLLQRYNQG